MFRLVQVSFNFPGVPKVRDLEPIFTAFGDDWIRPSLTNWILWTEKSTEEIYLKLVTHIDENDQILVTGIDDTSFTARVSPWIWEWFGSKYPGKVHYGDHMDDVMRRRIPPPTA